MEQTAINILVAVFGILGLTITLAAATLRQLPDLLHAIREARRALRGENPTRAESRRE
ncbi:hypothetical protein [Streptomyces salyersiae]|uniref:Uncharacterized protein n=1 Tax=Streptomyces salyersiae TaxID=3075530 RepID=A0ABU2RHL4_9ACTN|nr:hypothetical protein [Streptomyces sp. DSM 41770]MDT0427788.1 hypothetical protein [Streptomyces sp. DSM 41770]